MSRTDPRVAAALDVAGIAWSEIEHVTPVTSVAEAAAARGVPVDAVVKTIVVRRAEGDHVLVLVPGSRAISWSKLRRLLGVNRLSLPDAAEAFDATGFVRGTITPFGTVRQLPVIADERLAVLGTITLGSGARDVAVSVPTRAALSALGAQIADVTDEAPDRG